MNTDVEIKSHDLKPVLTHFLSINSYLQAYYNYRKAQNPHFSYENWASELDFKSRSSLRMMAYGKRNISEKLLENFVRKESFSPKETQYLVLLAKLQNTKNISLKKIFLEKISELTDFKVNKTEIKNAFDFLSNPEMYLIQMLISFKDFQATIPNLNKVLKFNTAKIKKALLKLEDMDLIEVSMSEASERKTWKSKAKFFCVTDKLEKPARQVFHQQTVKETEKIIHEDILDKKLKSLFFSLNEEDYRDLTEIIDQFANKVKTKYANDFIQNKKIYKMNVQLYPLTEKCQL